MGEEVRQMAAVLLRRLFANDFTDFYSKLNNEAKAQLKERVILIVQQEQSEGMRKKACEVAAEVARNLVDDDGNNHWPEFLEFLFQCTSSPNPAMKDSALRMFTVVPGVFGNQQANYLDVIKQMLQQSLVPTQTYEVRFQAVRATGAFILIHEKEVPILKHFGDLLPGMIQVLTESIEKQDDDTLLKVLIDMAECTPKYLRPQLQLIFEICMKVFSNTDVMDSWRQLTLEVMVTMSETAPAMVRRVCSKYVEALVPLILQMMTDLEDEADWSISDEIIDDDNDSNNVAAESALDRLACGLGGKTILPQVVAAIPAMLGSADWKQRHAALMAVSAVGEGCHKQMEAMLDQIMDGVLNFLSDPVSFKIFKLLQIFSCGFFF